MGMEKVTIMVLKVDLQCHCCYKKVKKTICKFPQIRDQIYDEKGNTVTITVVCCSPEKIRDKLCYKGGKAIKSIDIKEPEKKKVPEKPKEPEKPKIPEKPKVVVIEKPKEPEKSKVVVVEKPKEAEKPKVAEKPKEAEKPKPKVAEKPKDAEKPKEAPKNPEPVQNPYMMAESVPVQGFPQGYPVQPCFGPTYMAYGGVPSYHGYGVPPPPQPSYDGYYGYGHGHGHGAGSHVGRDDYFSDENPQGCSIM
ncbi:hypothetical protein ACJIZ3_006740 [Penstemon smallii]|uniref:HMA domain-containing protein n=1 Tax=Penstemon smallii TaxID=265156 RepID=A0ABD3S8K3_9LAMI